MRAPTTLPWTLAVVMLTLFMLTLFGCERAPWPTAPAGRVDAARVGAVPGATPVIEPESPAATPPGHSSLAPSVLITSPQPSRLIAAQLAIPATIEFGATDPDGPGPGVKSYRFRLFRDDDPDFLLGLVEPDSLMRKFAPKFVDWTELKGNATQLTLTDLVPGHRYYLVITAFDRKGNFDGEISFDRNALFFGAVAPTGPGTAASGRPSD